MSDPVTLPLWLFVLIVLLAAWAVLARLLVPGVRWWLRRRVNRVIDEVNTRLDISIRPFQLTKRAVLIDRLVYDPKVIEAMQAWAAEQKMPREVAQAQVLRYAREIVPAFNAYLYFRAGYWLAGKLARLLYRIRVTFSDSERLSKIDPEAAVVFVMNHRSNMDYVLAAFLAAEQTTLTKAGKFEAGYQLPMSFRVVGGIDYKYQERYVPYYCNVSSCGVLAAVTTREDSEELTYRVKFSHSLSETVNGALSLAHSNRSGSDLLNNVTYNNLGTPSNLISPINLADRKRDQVRLSLDWTPTEPLSLQFSIDESKDEYSGRDFGPREGKVHFASLDASYAFSDKWCGTLWLSRNETEANQVTRRESGLLVWTADLPDQGDAIGVGVRGKPTRNLELGADLQRPHDRGEYRFVGGPVPLPDTHYRVSRARLSGKYALNKDTTVGMNYIMEHRNIDDWTWSTWTYTDGTRLTQDPRQTTHFIGVYAQLKWW